MGLDGKVVLAGFLVQGSMDLSQLCAVESSGDGPGAVVTSTPPWAVFSGDGFDHSLRRLVSHRTSFLGKETTTLRAATRMPVPLF